MYGVIYLIIDGTNDFEYVGQTTRSVEQRFSEHQKSDFLIGKAIRAHGAENFSTAILKECANKNELDFWERRLIESRDTMVPNGYNLTDGGEGGIPCDETRAKLSAVRKGVPKSCEHRKKIGAAHKGKIVSDETRAKIGATSRGRRFSAETRAQMSEDRTGEKNYFFGRHHTDEAKSQSSAAHRGKSPFGNLLRELDARKWSYNRLAKFMYLSQATVSYKMRGKLKFTAEQIAKLVEIFELSAEYLLARDDGENALSNKRKTPYRNLSAEMDKQQLTYAALAKLLGLSRPTVSDKMRGKYSFTTRDIAKLVEIFGLSAEYLLARDEILQPPDSLI